MTAITRILPALALFILMSLTACDRLTPEQPDELDPESDFEDTLRASDIWQRYQTHPEYANDEFQGQWANIQLDGIRRIDNRPAGIDAVAGQTLIIRAPGKLGELAFLFRFREDTKDYERADQPIILCNIKGTDILREKLHFIHCRQADSNAPDPPPRNNS